MAIVLFHAFDLNTPIRVLLFGVGIGFRVAFAVFEFVAVFVIASGIAIENVSSVACMLDALEEGGFQNGFIA